MVLGRNIPILFAPKNSSEAYASGHILVTINCISEVQIMAKKTLSFLEQAQELERDNKRLRESLSNYQKLADAVLKAELNMDLKSVKKALENSGDSHSNESIFAAKICEYFGLKTVSDLEDFLRIMLSSSSLNYFNKSRQNDEVVAAEQDS